MFGTINGESEEIQSYGAYVSELRDRMRRVHEVASQHLSASAKRQAEVYDANVKLERYKSGDLVWFQTEMSQLRFALKLRRPYEEPIAIPISCTL